MVSLDKFPLDLVSRILSYLDGESLLRCAVVCRDFCNLTDQRSFWENAAWKLYPHLKETYDIMPYNGDWKALFQDRNRRNRSAVFEFAVNNFLTNPERRYSPSFRVENYNFKVIVDPVGNPNVYFLEPGVSVYLACSLANTSNGVNGASTVSEEENENGLDWECCCAFSLTACNQQRKGRNVTWHSSMLNDRFHKNRKNWGVHSLLPLTKLKDPSSGYVMDDTLRLKVRLRLLYLTVKVVRSSSLAMHRGFGIVDTTETQMLSYELFHCTTLAKFKEMLVRDLGLPSADYLRLWVFTQPWPDTVLCPRDILANETNNQQQQPDSNDEELNSPTLFSLLQLHMDGLGVARVWAECSSDGGFYHRDDMSDNRNIVPMAVAAPEDAAAATEMKSDHPAGADVVRGSCELVRGSSTHVLRPVPLWPDSRDMNSQQQALATPGEESQVVLFFKWIDPRTGSMMYLTHAVLRITCPVVSLFHLVGKLTGLDPTFLSFHIETTPANWQPGSTTMHRTISYPNDAQDLRNAQIENGQILCFYLTHMYSVVENVYRGYLDGLFRQAHQMYYADNNSPMRDRFFMKSKHHRTLKLEDVVNLFERFGYQSFRVRNVYYQHKHQNARQTLEYVIQGRHLGFCCDRCGATDFTGPRYKCTACYDYDLCSSCQEHPQAAAHRYKYEQRGWKRENHFNEHNKKHKMQMILPIPSKLHLLHP